MIDTHCHIDFKDFDHDREEVIVNATEFGVDRLINIGADIPSSRRAFKLANEYENIYCTVGVHPHDAKTLTDDFLSEMRTMTDNKKVVGIGEIGLDYYRDLSPRDIQKKAFIKQLDLAAELDYPIVIHVREAMDDALNIVSDYIGRLRGVFHCFPGTVQQAEQVIMMGFHVSVNGVMTYKNSKMANIGRDVPLEWILVETDCPYLTPAPHRGKRNCPAYVRFVCEKLAQLRDMDVAEVDKITTRNAEKLFRLVETFG
ncbi:MAG: TatD family hydrolase [Candidatus Zixiibacteriota bacterium]